MNINLKRYALVYVLASASIWLVVMLLQIMAGFEAPTSAGTVVPPMIAAMYEGQRHAQATGARAPSGDLWRAALLATGVVLGLNIVFMVVVLLATDLLDVVTGAPGVFVIAFLVVIVLILPLNRLFLGLGVRNELKRKRP